MFRSLETLRPLFLVLLAALAVSCSGDDSPAAEAATLSNETTLAESSTSTAAPTTTTSTTTTMAPPPDFEILEAGQYAVGVTTITVDADSDRPLTVDIWFPIADATARPPHQYTFFPGIYYESTGAVTAELSDIANNNTYPLVVYSHGSGGQRFIHSTFTESIASNGYVVIAPDHTGNTLLDEFAGTTADREQIGVDRPNDISAVIDVTDGTDPMAGVTEILLASLTDDPIVIAGHSMGGYTSYAVVAGPASNDGSFKADERIGAIIALAPAAADAFLTDEQLQAIDVPQMIIVGTDDKTTPLDPHVERPWALSVGSPTYRVELLAAEHLTFTDMCAYVDFLPELGTVPAFVTDSLELRAVEGCSVGDMDFSRAQDLTNTFAIGFLESVTNHAPFFDPDGVRIPDDVTAQVR